MGPLAGKRALMAGAGGKPGAELARVVAKEKADLGLTNCTALARLGRNSEVVDAAIHLASDELSFTAGQCIHVNGGRF